MEQATLETLVAEGLTLREIAGRNAVSIATTRYWLRKYGLKTRRGPHGSKPEDLLVRRCRCGETDPTKFYGRKTYICAKCQNQYNIQRGREKRLRIIQHLGGKCSAPECGFARYTSALQIHHLDPESKDPSFNSYRGWSWTRLEKELEQCVLLCACCHAAVHGGELEITGE